MIGKALFNERNHLISDGIWLKPLPLWRLMILWERFAVF